MSQLDLPKTTSRCSSRKEEALPVILLLAFTDE